MMAYNSGFVASIIKDGKVFRESADNGTRTVRLPFDSEYKIRLQNKNSVRAYARILIDGTEIHTGKFILRPNSSVDIERFVLDGDIGSGKKLKFVSAGHGDVQDPTAKENGLVEIIFEKEIEYTLRSSSTLYIKDGMLGHGSGVLRGMGASGHSFKSNSNGLEGSIVHTAYTNSIVGSTMDSMDLQQDKGATVEGGQSNQQFQESYENFAVCSPVSIQIQLRGQVAKKTWAYRNVPNGFIVTHDGVKLSLIEEVSLTAQYLTIRIPIAQVQIGS